MLHHPVEVPKCYVRHIQYDDQAWSLLCESRWLSVVGSCAEDDGISAQQYNLTDFLFAMSQLFGMSPAVY